MKNKEKYVDDIIAIASNGYNIAVRRVYEQVVGCEATECRDCVFLEGNCAENRQKWFESEADPTIDELKSELETLKKERDELRDRLKNAGILSHAVGDRAIIKETGEIRKCGGIHIYISQTGIKSVRYHFENLEGYLKENDISWV